MELNLIGGTFAVLFLAVSVYCLVSIRAESTNWHDDAEDPAWAKFLLFTVYFGATLLLVWALRHQHTGAHPVAGLAAHSPMILVMTRLSRRPSDSP